MGTLDDLKTVLGHVRDGRLRPVIDASFPLAEIAGAHRRLAERAVFGKVVVTL
jgi:NADPH:quinone reductase-like Zn-dependent oxidoreductase